VTRLKAWAGAAFAALLASATLWTIAVPATAATTVSTESELRAALADAGTSAVTLGASITLTDCSADGGDLDRDGELTLDGAGFTITQTCPGERVLESMSGTLTLEHVTITGGDQTATSDPTSVLGGGVRAANDLVLDDTTVTGNTVSGDGPSFGTGAWGSGAFGGGVEADGAITLTASHVDQNTARNAGRYGAGIFGGAGKDVTITDSTVDGNIGEAAEPAAEYGGANGGGVALVTNHDDTSTILESAGTVHLVRSAVSENVERPAATALTFAVGGGVFADAIVLESSHVDADELRPAATGNQSGQAAVGWGGGVFARTLAATGSTLDRNLAVPDGPQTSAEGAGAWSASGSVFLTSSTVRANSEQTGTTGSSSCAGLLGTALTLTGAVVSGNQASGVSAVGGGACADTATIDSSTIAGNSVTGTSGHSYGGGAIIGAGAVSSSTISGNSVTDTNAHGGGLVHDLFGGGTPGNLAVVNSTVTGNTASGTASSAGGIEQLREPTLENAGPLSLVFSTLAGNWAASGANLGNAGDTDPVTSFATTISDPLGGGTGCAGVTLTDQGYTQATDISCGTAASADPQLSALVDNGGPTATMFPAMTSPLLARVPIAACNAQVITDQRGITRPQASGCAVGAVERAIAAPFTRVDAPAAPPAGASVSPADVTAATPVVATPNFTG
jgi:hypothetical protein